MKVLVIGGFLGSGKTTLLLRVARELVARKLSIAVIENEIGTIGLDNQYLELEGVTVQELYGGCVCCTLKGSLAATLGQIGRALAPDWVLVEPSGVATPGDLVASLRSGAATLEAVRILNLLDAPRFEALSAVLQPMMEDYATTADVVAINKIDAVLPAVVAAIRQDIERVSPGKPVVEICADSGHNVLPLVDGVLGP